MDMPKRPRNHELEDESLRAMTSLLPAAWTVQEVSRDYGLDLRWEIFEGGQATGLFFNAQLKATDESDLDKALTRSLGVSALNYWHAQADPVLLVRYHATSRTLYGSWLHRQRIALDTGQKTFTYRWTASDKLVQASDKAILAEVARFRRLTRALTNAVSLQLPASVDSATRTVLTALISRSRAPITLVAGGADAVLEFEHSLSIDFGVTSFVAHGMTPSGNPTTDSSSILLACAVCIANLGRPDLASRLTMELPLTPLMEHEEVASLLVSAFQASGNLRLASELAARYRKGSKGQVLLPHLLSMAVLEGSATMSPQEQRAVEQDFLTTAEHLQAIDPVLAGTEYYSVGNWQFSVLHDYAAALASFHLAAKCRPDYEEQPYWLREVAAALFETRSFADSAEYYQRAHDHGAHPDVLACQADAWAHAGNSPKALHLFTRYETEVSEPSPRWQLKSTVLAGLRDFEHRVSAGLAVPDPAPDQQSGHGLVDPAFDIDALVRYATSDFEDADVFSALLLALAFRCAYPHPQADEPFGKALYLAFLAENVDMFRLVLAVGWYRLGDYLASEVFAELQDAELTQEFVAALEEGLAELRRNTENRVTLRLVSRDGKREEISVVYGAPETAD